MERKDRLHIGSLKVLIEPPVLGQVMQLAGLSYFFSPVAAGRRSTCQFLTTRQPERTSPPAQTGCQQAWPRQGTVLSIPSSSPYSTIHPAKIPSILPKSKHHRQVTFRPPRASESGHRTGLPATTGYRQRAARVPLSTQPPLDNRLRCLYLVRFPEAWKVVFAPVHCELNWYRCHVDQSIC